MNAGKVPLHRAHEINSQNIRLHVQIINDVTFVRYMLSAVIWRRDLGLVIFFIFWNSYILNIILSRYNKRIFRLSSTIKKSK